ncbi:MAG TPA: hypothetical protein VKB29_13755 [Candidatus Binataceae bacterium]|nr:hypothetical protein [Candidatus Binataceae bacterium]
MKIKSINLATGLSTIDRRGKIADSDNPDAGRAATMFPTGLAACNG